MFQVNQMNITTSQSSNFENTTHSAKGPLPVAVRSDQTPHSLTIQIATIESQSSNFAMTAAKVTTIKVAANVAHFFAKTLSQIGMAVTELPINEQTQITSRMDTSHAQFKLSLDQMVKSQVTISPDRRFGFSHSMGSDAL